jgi:hypothetical protein
MPLQRFHSLPRSDEMGTSPLSSRPLQQRHSRNLILMRTNRQRMIRRHRQHRLPLRQRRPCHFLFHRPPSLLLSRLQRPQFAALRALGSMRW